MRIAMNKYFNILRGRNKGGPDNPGGIDEIFREGSPKDPDWIDPFEDLESSQNKEEALRRIEKCLKELSSKCQERLRRFYFQRQSDKEIAEAMGDKSPRVSTTMRSKCMKKLRKCYFNK
jgi:RNA polymerase sigma factor (sigma-70 family)